ncbi:hypothetical protein Gpo141_00014705, partial [Globisporangium polare]
IYWKDDTFALVLVYVDDILCATKNGSFKKSLFRDLDAEYGLKDQGLLGQYLGIEVIQNDEEIIIHQQKYCTQVLERFGFGGTETHKCGNPVEVTARFTSDDGDDEKPSAPAFAYREAVGSLMYLATCTRPDVAYALGQLSRFVAKPSNKHIGTAKRVLRYLVGTTNLGIRFKKRNKVATTIELRGYSDSDWGNDPDTRKSITGYVFALADGAVSWMSKRQSIVALSTAEAEYVAACEATMEAKAAANILQEMIPHKRFRVTLGVDNKSAFIMATNPTYSRRTRHLEIRWHFIREQVNKKAIELLKVKSEDNPADLFIKPLASDKLKQLAAQMGMVTTNTSCTRNSE